MSLVVSEMFGPTIQGEGPHAGRLAYFLRLGGCNLSCSWCDTPYTWDASRHDLRHELRRVEVDEVLAFLKPACHIVITGGEPLLQAAALVDIVREYRTISNGTVIEVETNGTLPPPPWAPYVEWNVSPKLEHAGVEARALHPAWRFTPARYKFVVTGVEDLDEITRFKLSPRQVWVMPEGTTAERTLDVARVVADEAITRGWNLTLRTHVLLWGSERGR